MSQLSLLDRVEREERPRQRGHVPASSVEAYQRTHAYTRAVHVTDWLKEWRGDDPTSAELTRWAHAGRHTTDDLLYVRRGLSDALKIGLVQQGAKRKCGVAKTSAITWKVKSR